MKEKEWLRGMDLNHRPLGYEPNELPDCSTPHRYGSAPACARQTLFQVPEKLPLTPFSRPLDAEISGR